MPRLTEVVLNRGKPNVFFNGDARKIRILLPPTLRNKVVASPQKFQEDICAEQLGRLTACWKDHDWNEKKCLQELSAYKFCLAKNEEKKKQFRAAQSGGGPKAQGQKIVSSKIVSRFLTKYKHPPPNFEITENHFEKIKQHKRKFY